MGYYVYRYMHPDYPWLYVGKTDANLRNRIRTHDTLESDNIDRKHLNLLLESTVYYIELSSSHQTDYVEKLLIDKYKPYLNIKCKDDNPCAVYDFSLPPWKKLVRPSDLIDTNFLSLIDKQNVLSVKEELELLNSKYEELKHTVNHRKKQINLIQQELQSSDIMRLPYKLLQTFKGMNSFISSDNKYLIEYDSGAKTWYTFRYVDIDLEITNVYINSKKHPELDFSKSSISLCNEYLDRIEAILQDDNITWVETDYIGRLIKK